MEFKDSPIVEGGKVISINEKCYAVIEILKSKSEINNYLRLLINEELSNLKEENDLENISDEETKDAFKEELEVFYRFFEDIDDDLVIIHYIENRSGVKGLAKNIVNYLKDKYKTILLFSSQEAENYWEKNDFKRCFLDYFYLKKMED